MQEDQNPYLSPLDGHDAQPPGDEEIAMVQVASFANVAEAHLCQSVLREQGIASSLENEGSIGVNFLWSNAVGGVKVFVLSSSAERALEILAKGDSVAQSQAELPAITFRCEECDKEITFPGDRRGRVETCPKCHEYIDVPD